MADAAALEGNVFFRAPPDWRRLDASAKLEPVSAAASAVESVAVEASAMEPAVREATAVEATAVEASKPAGVERHEMALSRPSPS